MRPMLVVLALALVGLAAEAEPVAEVAARSGMAVNFEHALSSFVGGLVSLGLSLPVILFRIGRAIEKLDGAAERISRLEAWRDRHVETPHS